MRSATALLALCLSACRPEILIEDGSSSTGEPTGTGTDSTGAADSEGGTGPITEGCVEVSYAAKYAPVEEPGWELGCGSPELCTGDKTIVFYVHGALNAPTAVETKELERARCMATALRDREVGSFDYVVVGAESVVMGLGGVEILGEEAIGRWEPGTCSLKPCQTTEALRQIRAPGFFSDCVHSDAKALWLCISRALEEEPSCLLGPLPCG